MHPRTKTPLPLVDYSKIMTRQLYFNLCINIKWDSNILGTVATIDVISSKMKTSIEIQ
jgi:hypothetical protein